VGSILRTAFFLGVEEVIANQNNMCPLTPAVAKVSAGAVDFMRLYSVKYPVPFFQDASKAGFKVIGTGLDSENNDDF